MRPLALILALATLPACSAKSFGRGIDLGHKALAAVDIAADYAGEGIEAGAEAVVATCRSLYPDATEEERIACVTKAGYSPERVKAIEEATRAVAAAYDAIAVALAELEAAWPVLEQALADGKAAVR